MCNYILNVVKCRQCGRTTSQNKADYVYCPSYRNGISCQVIERGRNTRLVCCSKCQNSYRPGPAPDVGGGGSLRDQAGDDDDDDDDDGSLSGSENKTQI
ncbi:hypothetical protein CTA1_6636 [Colletotrichum tanaceti]|uniref:Uncharacterized protein n=1 Tax=Colletotrichum tanaceti TaxID=1306861 RepID=A0A4U6XNA8_9PEZI|nr:hypothetical protein CTA1_6636 [Colletotrichum tanaceti]